MLLNLCIGPFKGCAWYQTIKAAMATYMAMCTCSCQLFAWFYQNISLDFNVFSHQEFGQRGHMQRVFQMIPSAEGFLKKGLHVKLSRWMSLWDSLEWLIKFWYAYGLILHWILICTGIVKKREDLPAFSGFLRVVPAGPADGADPDERAGAREVRNSNAEAERMRKKAHNQLHMAAMVCASDLKRNLMQGLLFIMRPVRLNFGHMLTALKTRRGAKAWWSLRASGRIVGEEIVEIWSCLANAEQLRACRFLSMEDFFAENDDSVEADRELATHLFRAASCLVAERLLGELCIANSMPGKTAALISDDPDIAAEALKDMKVWFIALTGLGKSSFEQSRCT